MPMKFDFHAELGDLLKSAVYSRKFSTISDEIC